MKRREGDANRRIRSIVDINYGESYCRTVWRSLPFAKQRLRISNPNVMIGVRVADASSCWGEREATAESAYKLAMDGNRRVCALAGRMHS